MSTTGVFFKKPWVSCLVFALFPAVQLLWEKAHGGIVSHYLLHREDLPAISNVWGLLTIPVLAYLAFWFLKSRRLQEGPSCPGGDRDTVSLAASKPTAAHIKKTFWWGLLGGLAFGALLSVFWALGLSEYMGPMLLIPLLLAFFFPSYRAECLLGFVLGMSWTFGGVLPLAVGLILVLGSWCIHKGIRPGILRLVKRW